MDRAAENSQRATQISTWLSAASLFHKAEVVYVVVMTIVAALALRRVRHDLNNFVTLWDVICLVAAVVVLTRRAPRGIVFLCEATLLIVAIGLWIAPHAEVFPLLGRKIRDVEKWNSLPLEQRRLLAWNFLAFLTLAWLALPYFVLWLDSQAFRGDLPLPLRLLLFIPVWIGVAFVFVSVARLTLS